VKKGRQARGLAVLFDLVAFPGIFSGNMSSEDDYYPGNEAIISRIRHSPPQFHEILPADN
jgi:hypothetical protein